MSSNVIITSSNAKQGDFMVNNWLRSLIANVNLSDTDIVILDYGLTEAQQVKIRHPQVRRVTCSLQGNIVNTRFIDTKKFLLHTNYRQVLFVDSGDIIFQTDISSLFTEHADSFRAVLQDINHMYFATYIPLNFTVSVAKVLWNTLKGKDVINAGVLFAPVPQFIELCTILEKFLLNTKYHGSDQVIVNYVLYSHKTMFLDKTYNYMLATVREEYTIRNGIFYRPDGTRVAIVHNAGRFENWRPIENFGYGPGYNFPRPFKNFIRKTCFGIYKAITNISSISETNFP